ncbi:MAG: sensor histidine kinase [bacterium]
MSIIRILQVHPLLHSILPGLCLIVGALYSFYVSFTRRIGWAVLAGIIFILGSFHQGAEIITWLKTGKLPSPDWVMGDSVETSVYLLAVACFIIFVVYYDRSKRLLKEKDLLLEEVQHRVKNNLQSIQSLISIQERSVGDDKIQSIFRKLQDHIQSFVFLNEQLQQTDAIREADTQEYLTRLCHALESYEPEDQSVELKTDIQSITLSVDQLVNCGLIVSELVENAYEHSFNQQESGVIRVLFEQEMDHYRLVVEDDGQGIEEESDLDSAGGLRIVRSLVKYDLSGRFEVQSDEGLRATVTFPR